MRLTKGRTACDISPACPKRHPSSQRLLQYGLSLLQVFVSWTPSEQLGLWLVLSIDCRMRQHVQDKAMNSSGPCCSLSEYALLSTSSPIHLDIPAMFTLDFRFTALLTRFIIASCLSSTERSSDPSPLFPRGHPSSPSFGLESHRHIPFSA